MKDNGSFQITLKLLLWDQDYYLLLKDSFTKYGDLPGGRITQEELYNFKRALQREIFEELGKNVRYKIYDEPVYCFPHFVSKDKKDAIAIIFEGIYFGGEIQLSSEHEEYLWVHRKEPLEKHFSDTMLYGLQKYFSKFS